MTTEAKCPFSASVPKNTVAHGAQTNADWWPKQLKLGILHQHSSKSDPMDPTFDYVKEFKTLDLNAVVQDITVLMTD